METLALAKGQNLREGHANVDGPHQCELSGYDGGIFDSWRWLGCRFGSIFARNHLSKETENEHNLVSGESMS